MRETYGTVSALAAGASEHSDFDAGGDDNQITLYIDQSHDLTDTPLLVSIKSLNTAGTGGGSTVWSTLQAQARVIDAYGPATNADEGLLLSASAPNSTKWRIEFENLGGAAALPADITWMAVCGRSVTPHFMAQKVHLAAQDLAAAGAWVVPADQYGVQPLRFVSFGVTYVAASATGGPKFRVIWTDALGNSFEDTASNAALIQLSEPVGPVPGAAAGSQSYTFAAENLGAYDRVRLEVAEAGDTANPGNVELWISGRSNQ